MSNSLIVRIAKSRLGIRKVMAGKSSLWLLVALPVLLCCAIPVNGRVKSQRERYDDARGLVGRVQEDLRHAEQMASQHKHSKEIERIDNAERHLSDFDRSMSKGKFDSGKLGRAISDVKNVIDHNTLSPADRDNLNADLRDLRSMRSSRGR